MTVYCHKAVRQIAREMAGSAYEQLASNDKFYQKFPSQGLFIARHWKNFVGIARGTLVYMLGQNHPDAIKEDLYDIIIKDRILQQVHEDKASSLASALPQGSA